MYHKLALLVLNVIGHKKDHNLHLSCSFVRYVTNKNNALHISKCPRVLHQNSFAWAVVSLKLFKFDWVALHVKWKNCPKYLNHPQCLLVFIFIYYLALKALSKVWLSILASRSILLLTTVCLLSTIVEWSIKDVNYKWVVWN